MSQSELRRRIASRRASSVRPLPPRRRSRSRRPGIERLESRRPLAADLHAPLAARRELVVLDESVPDLATLLADLARPSAPGVVFETLVIPAEAADGWSRIGATLEQALAWDAVHLVTHGRPGELRLGATSLTSSTGDLAAELATWRARLDDGADLLLYGCNVASGAMGQEFSHWLADVTGADVAASENLTGGASLGGDWWLEATTGPIETPLALSPAAQASWTGTLLIGQEFYIPLPEDQLRTSLVRLYASTGTTLDSTIAIAPAGNPGIIYYDQWEDGYESNIESPTQTTTQIWGDNNPANGIPPGFATDVLIANSVITLRNNISVPRSASTTLFDGRDRVATTKSVSVTRSAWATNPGTVLADAVEVVPVNNWGLEYIAPIGQNAPNTAYNQMFEYVSMLVMASTDATTIQIDRDGNGTVDITQTLNRGQSYQVDGNVMVGARVTSDKPVQVTLMTGDVGAQYESRWYSLYPRASWGSNYYTPVGTTQADDPATVFIYNPNTTSILVTIQTAAGEQTVTVPASTDAVARGLYQFTMPLNSGAHIYAIDITKQFFAIGAMDSDPTGAANNVHDWGYTLVPENYLTPSLKVGWAPGSGAIPITSDGSPVWVMAVEPTRIYVDYDGSPATGPLVDPNGQRYNVHYDVGNFQSVRVYDPDLDQTGMRLYTVNGVKIAGAWGQDPAVAGAGVPFLDVGYTVLPQPVFYLRKDASIPVGDGDSYVDPGETIEYSLVIRNDGVIPLFGLNLTDPLPANTSYVLNSTVIENIDGSGQVPIPDNGAGTPYPLDLGGHSITTLAVGEAKRVRFRILVDSSLPPGTTQVANTAVVTGGDEPLIAQNILPVQPPTPPTCGALDFANSSYAPVASYIVDSNVYLQVNDSDANLNSAAVDTVTISITVTGSGDRESVTLTETGAATGLFQGAIGSSSSVGQAINDGTLYALVGDTLNATYLDSTCAGGEAIDTAAVTQALATKPLYLDTDGVDGDTTGELDRIDPVNVTPQDTTTSQSTLMGTGAGSVSVASTTSTTTTTGTTHTFSHTPGAGANRLLLVAIGVGATSAGGTASTVSGVTFGGAAMTLVASQSPPSATGVRSYLYSLLNPGSAAANVVVTTAGNASIAAGATTLTGVDQSTPLGTFAANSANNGTSGAVVVSSATGQVVFSTAAWDEGGSNQSITVAAGQSSLWEVDGTNFVSAAASTKPGAASVTSTYTSGDSQEWTAIAVPVRPAPGGASTITFTQTPALSSALTLPASAGVGAQVYVEMTAGAPSAGDAVANVSLALSGGSPAFPSLGTPTYTLLPSPGPNGGAVYRLQWSAALPSATTVAAGTAITATLTTTDNDFSFRVLYDSATYPSAISLPTTTYINVESLGVYDAPFTNDGNSANDGNLINNTVNGQTVYVRALVSDPFGEADITGLTMNISPVVGAVTPTRIIPAGTNGQAIYEYAWTTGTTQATFDITVEAEEGYEGTVTDTAGTQFTVSFLDVGTPSITEFTNGLNGPGTDTYSPGATVCVRVTDIDQNLNSSVVETVTATITTTTGDTQTITLTETGPNTGVFAACASGSTTINVPGDNIIHDPFGTGLNVSYTDPTDPTDISNDTATVPAATPQMAIAKTLLTPVSGVAAIGDTLKYRITLFNTGSAALTSVTLDDDYASSCMSFVSATLAPVSPLADPLQWNLGTLAAGASLTIETTYLATAACSTSASQNVATGDSALTAPVTANASVLIAGRISGQVRDDIDADGYLGSPDSGIPAVPVTLYNDVNGNGQYDVGVDTFVAATTTASDGTYQFTGLPAGDYVVVETDLAGYTSTNDADAPNNNQVAATVPAGGAVDGQDFLDTQRTLPDTSLTKQVSDPAPVIGSTVTFTIVVSNAATAGEATEVSVTDVVPSGYTYVPGSITGGTNRSEASPAGSGLQWTINALPAGTTATLTFQAVVLAAGNYSNYAQITGQREVDADSTPNNGPQVPDEDDDDSVVTSPVAIPLATISGSVLVDTNNDNLGDTGLPGVSITLYSDPNGDGDPSDGAPIDDPNLPGFQTYTVVTDGSGNYTLTNVSPGNYVLVETQPVGYISLSDGDTTLPGDDASNASPTDNRIPVSVVAGETDDGNVFTEYPGQPPIAVNDSRLSMPPGPVTLQVTANDSDPNHDLDPATVDLDPATPGRQTALVVAGEGTWTVENSGWVTFTPNSGFSLDPTSIPYTVQDATGLTSNIATITIEFIPIATNNSSTGHAVGAAVTQLVPANDTTGDMVDPTTVQIVGTSAPNSPLVVPGEGVWTVNPLNGAITFTPEISFLGDPTPIRYTIQDFQGNVSNPALVVVDYVDLSCTGHPFTLVLDDQSTPQIDIIIVDNAPIGTPTAVGPSNAADQSNTTLGEIYFSGGTAQFQLARVSARSKPLVGGAIEPSITLTSAFRSSNGGAIYVQATDSCYSVVTGTPYTFDSPIGGTTNGTVSFTETVDPLNQDFANSPSSVTNAIGPILSGTVAASASGNFTPTQDFASLHKGLLVSHPSGPKLTTLTAGGTVHPLSVDPRDVDQDGAISPLDALLIINYLNSSGDGRTTDVGGDASPRLDVSRDTWVSGVDALLVINYLNDSTDGEGEASADIPRALSFAGLIDNSQANHASASSLATSRASASHRETRRVASDQRSEFLAEAARSLSSGATLLDDELESLLARQLARRAPR